VASWRALWLVPMTIAAVGVSACGERKPALARHVRTAAKHSPSAHKAWALAVAPIATRGSASRRAAIPILMYHVMSAAPPGAPEPQLWVSRRRFAGEMAALQRAGYHAITLATAVRAWRHGGPLPHRPIVISFDDGYRSDYTHARPVLRRLAWPGVLNLVLANVGPGGVTAREVRGLIGSGWEIDSHTLTHPNLTTLPSVVLRHELVGSRAEIRHRFGQPADFFCYPSGRYDARVVAAVRAGGYRAATTVNEGYAVASQPFTLKRIRVNGADTAATLLARLRAERPS
jgi:peptidoglycan/xylan/chitin deacetylase (PgdA/CDA1 family)